MNRKRVVRGVGLALAGVVLLTGIAEAVLWWRADRAVKRAEARWAASKYGSLERAWRDHPRNQTNLTALALEKAAADLSPSHLPDCALIPGSVGTYVHSALEITTAEIPPAPPEVSAYLWEHKPTVDTVRCLLLEGSTPAWECRPEAALEEPGPPVFMLIDLQRLLAADALAALQVGDEARSLNDLEALWRMAQALSGADFDERMLRWLAVRYSAGILRKIPAPPPAWPGRLRGIDPRRDMAREAQHDACRNYIIARGRCLTGALEAKTPLDWLFLPAGRTMMADSAGYYLDAVQAVETAGSCTGPYDKVVEGVLPNPPGSNVIAWIAIPNLEDGWKRADRLGVDLELTERVLELKGFPPGTPLPLSREKPSRACPGTTWSVTSDAGKTVVTLTNPPPSLATKGCGLVLPLRCEMPAAH